jgi:hypothetical protein
MTCSTCKHYYPYSHKHEKDFDGICRFNPPLHVSMKPRYISVKAVGWCGQWKTMKTRKQTKNKIEYSDEFKAFYEAYPKKNSPDVAWRSWSDETVLLPEHYQLVIERAKAYAEACVSEAKDMQYVKHPSTWLRAGDWKTKTEKKLGTKDCIECGAPYASGHKYVVKGKYRCEKCRKK